MLRFLRHLGKLLGSLLLLQASAGHRGTVTSISEKIAAHQSCFPPGAGGLSSESGPLGPRQLLMTQMGEACQPVCALSKHFLSLVVTCTVLQLLVFVVKLLS